MQPQNEIVSTLLNMSRQRKTPFLDNSVLIELNCLMTKPEQTLAELENIIMQDADLAAFLLNAASSDYYNFPSPVQTIEQAVELLGVKSIHKLVTLNVLAKAINNNPSHHVQKIWTHSLGTACAARVIAQEVRPDNAEEMFTAGLLHDIGSILIYEFFPDKAEKIRKATRDDENHRLLMAEKQILSTTHQEIGAGFLKEYDFPAIHQICAATHHFFTNCKTQRDLSGIVVIANNLAKAIEIGESENSFIQPVPSLIWNMIELREYRFNDVIKGTYKEFKNILKLLSN